MDTTISKQTKTELLAALRERYQRAAKAEKTRVLDEFVAVARRTYDEAVREALIVLGEAADRICGKRLKAILPDLVLSLEQHGHLALDPTVRQLLLAASAATIDRLLASVRSTASGRKKR